VTNTSFRSAISFSAKERVAILDSATFSATFFSEVMRLPCRRRTCKQGKCAELRPVWQLSGD
jgi:hypothetical protein